MVVEYIKEAYKNKKYLIIKNKNTDKEYSVMVTDFDNRKVNYKYKTSKQAGSILLANIKNIKFEEESINNAFLEKYLSADILNYKNYYLKYIKENTPEEFKTKEKLFTRIFNYLNDSENLLWKFLKKDKNNLTLSNDFDIPLLVEQSNQSQKKAIINSLTNKVSIIEGPPGTGKTTTILSLIANLICQNKKVIVVSKNNSAVDNIIEEYDKLNFPRFFIRFGENKIMTELEKNIDQSIEYLKMNFPNIEKFPKANVLLLEIKKKLNQKENQLNQYITLNNVLTELKNHERFMNKKMDCYNFEKILNKKEQKFLSSKLGKIKNIEQAIQLCKKEKFNFLDKFLIHYKYHLDMENITSKFIALKNIIEKYYLENEMAKLEKQKLTEKIKNLKEEIQNMYNLYTKICKNIFLNTLHEKIQTNLYNVKQNDTRSVKEKMMQLYPLILTTADAFLFNFKEYIETGAKVDCIIIDEATQCDIITGLPLLFLTKQLIVVGDSKQLSAITPEQTEALPIGINPNLQYENNNFLMAIKNIFQCPTQLLKEHYRCDYNIINFCNKYYYDNKLQIYTNHSFNAMKIVNTNKQKACNKRKSYYNEREIITLQGLTQNTNMEKNFFITPFTEQSNLLKQTFTKENCGTIHTFQGKGNDYVYFNTVFNDLEQCQNHIKSKWNMFTKELINVAVSRAKKEFFLVGDCDFFKKYASHCIEMKHLIDYIEIYGKEIEDKTVCLYDNAYKQIRYYNKTKKYDSLFEELLDKRLRELLKSYPHYSCYLKLPLEDFITDKKYLKEHPDIKKYILNKLTHVDYTILDNRSGKPTLTIELDGKYHDFEPQKSRDLKKKEALNHMNIPLIRISSKSIKEIENLDKLLKQYLL